MSLNLQKDIEKIKADYEKLFGGDLTIDEFWRTLLPFVNNLLNGQDKKEYRDKIGQVNVESLNRLLINLRDKKQSYNSNNDIGDTEQARRDEKLFVTASKNIIDKLNEIFYNYLNKDSTTMAGDQSQKSLSKSTNE